MKNLLYLLLLIPTLFFAQAETLDFNGKMRVTYERDANGNVTGGKLCFGTYCDGVEKTEPIDKDIAVGLERRANLYGYNVSTESDSLVGAGAFEAMGKQRIRSFYLMDKNQTGNGVYKDGGVSPKNMKFFKTPKVYKSRSWDGTYYANKFRFQNLAKRVSELTITLEVILDGYGNYRKFPRKDYEYWELGNSDAEVYDTVYDMSETFFIAHSEEIESGAIKFCEIRNESWLYTAAQWKVIERAFMDAWIKYNRGKGRGKNTMSYSDYANTFLPKLGTNALPLGQGAEYPLKVIDLATSFAECYTYVNVHVYAIDSDGKWSNDFSIIANQLAIAENFQSKYFPNATIRITETGAENLPNEGNIDPLYIYSKLDEYVSTRPVYDAIFGYSLVRIKNSRFGKCFLWHDGQWNEAGQHVVKLNRA